MRVRRVGGIWFLRLWRVQFSFCLCRAERPHKRTAKRRYKGNRVIVLDLSPTFVRTDADYPIYAYKRTSLMDRG